MTCTLAPVRGKPHPSQDLIQLFRLTDIATEVRRFDPVTGEKINKLRKSYVGKIKSLKVSGKNEAPSYPGMWLPNLMIVPDDDWTNTVVRGKMPEDVTKTPDWSSKLKKALEMAKGPLPSQLSQELATFTDLGAAPAGKLMKPPNGRDALKRPALGVHARTTPVLPAKVLRRPERSGAKRSYDDTSFAGYGEGFVDEDDGNSTDSRLDHKKKRQRTVGSDQTLPVCASTN